MSLTKESSGNISKLTNKRFLPELRHYTTTGGVVPSGICVNGAPGSHQSKTYTVTGGVLAGPELLPQPNALIISHFSHMRTHCSLIPSARQVTSKSKGHPEPCEYIPERNENIFLLTPMFLPLAIWTIETRHLIKLEPEFPPEIPYREN